MECVLSVSWWSLFHLLVERVCQLMGWYTCQLMECVSLDLSVDGVIYLLVDSVFHLICQLVGWLPVSWWSVSSVIDRVFHLICQLMVWYTCQLMECVSLGLSVDGECFTWSVSWWRYLPVSWWSVSPDLSVDGLIHLSVDGVCFTWSVSWWSVFHHKVTFVLDCSLNSWYTFCLSVVIFLAALWNLWNSAW